MENIGNLVKAQNNKEAAGLPEKEKEEKVIWSGWVDILEGTNDKAGEREESIFLSCKDGKFYADNAEVEVDEFLGHLGAGKEMAFKQNPELRTIIAKALIEKSSKDKLN